CGAAKMSGGIGYQARAFMKAEMCRLHVARDIRHLHLPTRPQSGSPSRLNSRPPDQQVSYDADADQACRRYRLGFAGGDLLPASRACPMVETAMSAVGGGHRLEQVAWSVRV